MHIYGTYSTGKAKKRGKVAFVLNELSIMPRRGVGEWVYRSTFSWPRHQFEVSGELHAHAALPPEKEPPVPIG
jgi:hypothetical protein